MIGIQGGHQLSDIKNDFVSVLDPILEKIIILQKKSNISTFYQFIDIDTYFGVRLEELLTSHRMILSKIKRGMKVEVKFNILNKLDEIIGQIIKIFEDSQAKS